MTDAFLKKAFYNSASPASFSGPSKLYKYGLTQNIRGLTLGKIKNWLKKQETYTLYRKKIRKFPRNKIIVPGPFHQWDVDLMDVGDLAQENDGVKFVIIMIDVFSRMAYTKAIKNKNATTIVEAFKEMFSKQKKPTWIRTDKGGEFVNAKVKAFLKKENIGHIITQNETKANYAERLIKTLKLKIVRLIFNNNNLRYIDDLEKLTKSYNHTFHRTIKEKPINVTEKNKVDIYQTQYIDPFYKKKVPKKAKFAYKVGDTVRISHLRQIFSREYDVKWTGEIFNIIKRFKRENIPIYEVEDFEGDPVKGTFYQSELQAVTLDKRDLFKIERIIDTRGKGKKKESLVKWLNWPDKYNSWVPSKDIEKLK